MNEKDLRKVADMVERKLDMLDRFNFDKRGKVNRTNIYKETIAELKGIRHTMRCFGYSLTFAVNDDHYINLSPSTYVLVYMEELKGE